MEINQKRKFSAEFKSKVVIEALKEHHTIEELIGGECRFIFNENPH